MEKYIMRVKGIAYNAEHFCIPGRLLNRIDLVKQFFRAEDKINIPLEYRRRKTYYEYGETCLVLLERMETLYDLKKPVALGSSYLSPTPWAILGNYKSPAKSHFSTIQDLGAFYGKTFVKSGNSTETFYFRQCYDILEKMANRYGVSKNHIMAVALALMHDVLVFCGPDCPIVFDIFSNDSRVKSSGETSILEWENLRHEVLGKSGKIQSSPSMVKLGQLVEPYIDLKTHVILDDVSTDELETGEKLLSSQQKQIDVPDLTDGLEADIIEELIARHEEENGYCPPKCKTKKYEHLGIENSIEQ